MSKNALYFADLVSAFVDALIPYLEARARVREDLAPEYRKRIEIAKEFANYLQRNKDKSVIAEAVAQAEKRTNIKIYKRNTIATNTNGKTTVEEEVI